MAKVNDLEAAQRAKDKGNAAFKIGDFPIAIGHYTAAILADHNDFTLPLNRAAAYLKLGKNEDAERDCTTVLSLSAANVKGLFRRGQARLGLGKLDEARQDLVKASKSEPANNAIQEELKRVDGLLEKKKAKQLHPLAQTSSLDTTPKRRRVPITIIDSTTAGPSNSQPPPPVSKPSPKTEPKIPPSMKPATDTLEPVSSRSLKSQSPPVSSSPSPTIKISSPGPLTSPSPPLSTKQDEPRTFKQVKQARESAKPSRVGGGIFRASGDSTIFPSRTETVPSPTVSPTPATITTPAIRVNVDSPATSVLTTPSKTPTTLFDFSRSWSSTPATEDRWALISAIPPASLPTLFKTSLEPSLLVDILQVFEKTNDERQPLVREYMENFARVPRFGTVVLFLSRKEKDLAKQVWGRLGVEKDTVDPVWGKCF